MGGVPLAEVCEVALSGEVIDGLVRVDQGDVGAELAAPFGVLGGGSARCVMARR
jgi:hypothetical protein